MSALRWLPVVLLLLSPTLARTGELEQAEELLRQARVSGAQYLQSKDKNAKKSTETAIEQAQKLFEKADKKDRSCQRCAEGLAASQFFETYFGFSKKYKDCLETADKGLARFPSSARLAYFKGYAHFSAQQFAEASRSLNRFLVASVGEPEAEAQARQLLEQARTQFLDTWYKHADFYQSDESRVSRFNPQTKQNEVILQVTPEYETGLGHQAFQAITGQAKRVEDVETQMYLERLVNRLVEKTPGPGFRYQVTVVDSPEVNAVTPPGHIIVYTGLLAFAENEAELAGVLAHELAHNYGHHSARTLIKAYHSQVLASAIVGAVNQALKPKNELVALLPNLVANLGLNLYMKAYSRQEEKEADLYGAHILYNAGYSPTAMSSFFARLYGYSPKQPPKFLSTHPPLPDRADYLIDYTEAFPLEKEMKADSEDFQKLRARLVPAGAPATARKGEDDRLPMPALP
jgi:predicted Zn-dependent protease